MFLRHSIVAGNQSSHADFRILSVRQAVEGSRMTDSVQPQGSSAARLAASRVGVAKFDALLAELEQLSPALEDGSPDSWPGTQFKRLAETGVLGWVIPTAYGGCELSGSDLTYGYEQLAAACLPTAFVLTQRNGACQRIAGGENEELKADLLPCLNRGEIFATVGISHLTTSRQHLRQPAVRAHVSGVSFVFEGTVPWVTGAGHADYIVTGGTCDDGRQVLATIPTSAGGVTVQPPPRLLALNATQTGSVLLDGVEIDKRLVISGPVERVMHRGQGGGTGSLTTSALAVGTTTRVLRLLKQEAENRPDLAEIHHALDTECASISADMYRALSGDSIAGEATPNSESIRQRANSLVLRATQAYLAACKGAGFVEGHAAARAVREAMFFLVWSCPQPVLTAALREFACVVEG
jgi:alkylation response protein AidB-like acyl-CoA dehydrogenase